MAVIPTGVDVKYFCKIEAAYDTGTAFVSADAMAFNDLEITPTREFHKSAERVGSASLQREIEGISGGTWSATLYCAPNGSSVTAQPDSGAIYEAAFGAVDTSGDVSYRMNDGGTPATEVTAVKSLQIGRWAGTHFSEIINGAWIEQFDVEVVGNGETIVSVSGGFSSYGWCYGSTIVTAVASTSATTFQVTSGRSERLGAGSQIQFSDGGTVSDNGGAGWLITAVDPSDDTITINAATGVTMAVNTQVQPLDLAQTLSATASPIGGINCALTIGGESVGMISFKASIKTGVHGLSAEASASRPTRLSRGAREVTGELSHYFLAGDTAATDMSLYAGDAHYGRVRALVATAGSATKNRMKINIASARLEVSPVSIPEAEEAVITMAFVARKGTQPGDEISIDFD